MKLFAYFFISVFLAFLATPTVVTLIERDADVSYVFSLAEEEENHKGEKEGSSNINWKLVPKTFNDFTFFDQTKISFNFFYLLGTSSVYSKLVSPPPELA